MILLCLAASELGCAAAAVPEWQEHPVDVVVGEHSVVGIEAAGEAVAAVEEDDTVTLLGAVGDGGEF